ncbi:MAG: hypothetical protein AAGE52_14190 [Myxococcota bacterium]
MRQLVLWGFLGLALACGGGGDAESTASSETSSGTEDEVAVAESTEPSCHRNSSEVCDCPGGGSALRICDEGTWTDCACDGSEEDFGNDDLAFDDE